MFQFLQFLLSVGRNNVIIVYAVSGIFLNILKSVNFTKYTKKEKTIVASNLELTVNFSFHLLHGLGLRCLNLIFGGFVHFVTALDMLLLYFVSKIVKTVKPTFYPV